MLDKLKTALVRFIDQFIVCLVYFSLLFYVVLLYI